MTSQNVTADREDDGQITLIKISGTLNRRIESAEFGRVSDVLRAQPGPLGLIMDLVDLAALDSKGEAEIERALADAITLGKRACIIIDDNRRYLYVALEELVDALGPAARVTTTEDAARTFIEGPS